MRQVLFDILGVEISWGPVLDLYAGSGALGIEALSRGCPAAVFVESGRGALAVLRRNLADLSAGARGRVIARDVGQALRRLEREGARFRWILADPPYGDPQVPQVLRWLGAASGRLLDPAGGLVLETRKNDRIEPEAGRLRRERVRQVGDTALHFFRPRPRTREGDA